MVHVLFVLIPTVHNVTVAKMIVMIVWIDIILTMVVVLHVSITVQYVLDLANVLLVMKIMSVMVLNVTCLKLLMIVVTENGLILPLPCKSVMTVFLNVMSVLLVLDVLCVKKDMDMLEILVKNVKTKMKIC